MSTPETIALVLLVGTALPLALLTAGWRARQRRAGTLIISLAVAIGANALVLAYATPAAAVSGNSNIFYLHSTTAFGCTRDMTQTASAAVPAVTIPGLNGQAITFCSDTFDATQSMSSGNAVVTLWLANADALNACSITAELFHNLTSLGSVAITAPAATGTAVQHQGSFAVTGFTYTAGERLRLVLTWGATNCALTALSYDSSLTESTLVTATIVPEAALALAAFAPLVPLGVGHLRRRRGAA